ncbi:DUF3862 domain-containing protein [Lactobacillus terrae]|uniref:DUF3862 domain-containing protein n=1 Tax=Lactobacillus terrae TaxID=2269374 RepID=UPI000C1B6FD5|nr:DUF3862 domain-containing protein [Lactobacillus terrae]
MPQEKPFYKTAWFWTLIVAILVIIGFFTGVKIHNQKEADKREAAANAYKVTYSDYSKIKVGLTDGDSADKVKKDLGKTSTSNVSKATGTEIATYSWNKVKNGDVGSNIAVTITDGHATNKTISGLKVKRDKKINLKQYNSVKVGAGYNDTLDKLGKPNSYLVTINKDGTTTKTIGYTSGLNGGDSAMILLTFNDNRLSDKSQLSLK